MKKILLTTLVAVFALSVQADLIAVDHTHYGDKSTSKNSSAVKAKAVKTVKTVKAVKVVKAKATSQNNQYRSAVKLAKLERKRAKKLGFEWRDIGKFLKKADKLYKKGDVNAALKLVNKARIQAVLGQRQARDQANAGPQHF